MRGKNPMNQLLKKAKEEEIKQFQTKEKLRDEVLERLHSQAEIVRPLLIDEVAASFIATLRVSAWQSLGEDFGGYKQGRLFSYVLSILNKKIEHSCDYLDKNKKVEESEEKYCMYCKEKDGTINHDVFIQISDEELGVGWVCKECFLESEKEKDELMYTQQQNIINKNNVLNRIKEIAKEPFEIDGNSAFLQIKVQNRFRDILTLVTKGLEEE